MRSDCTPDARIPELGFMYSLVTELKVLLDLWDDRRRLLLEPQYCLVP